MEQMSLVAVCKEHGLSRRAIQGYEKEGLIKPSGKNKQGYLLYDEKVVHRILFIKHCQNIGFKLKEIKGFINESNETIKERIEDKIPYLEMDITKTKHLIVNTKKIIELLDYENSEEQIYQITKKENI